MLKKFSAKIFIKFFNTLCFMKALFVYPNIVTSPKDMSTGVGVLAAVLKKAGHEVALVDTTFGKTDEEILRIATDFGPDLIAVTTATNDFVYATHISTMLKNKFDLPVVAGGFHALIAPEEIISKDCFDYVCVGEGEDAILKLVKALEDNKSPNKISNLWIKDKKSGKIIKNSIRPLVHDLDELPIPDREIFNYAEYIKWNRGVATFLSTRGCPYQCTYCINHFLIKKYTGKGAYVRFRSIDNLFLEIKDVIKKYGEHVKAIEFYDDTFTLDKKRVEEFCARYSEEIGIPFDLNVRVNAVNLETFRLLKKAGCRRVSIGIESGDEEIRNKVLKRNMSEKEIIDTFRAAKSAGLGTYAFNMIGVPYETKESINKTIRLNKICRPDYVGVSIFNAFRGTELYDLAKEQGLLKKGYSKSYFYESNINHPNFSEKDLIRIRNSFGFRVFFSRRPLWAIADLVDKNLAHINEYIFIRSKLLKIVRAIRK